MLTEEIKNAQRFVRTDAYQMSVGEIVSMYQSGEIIIDPEFQRLFRWSISQRTKLIESILLGIPLPSIFVFEREDGLWELVDGLQRVSTILEFMGLLRDPEGNMVPPSVLEATKYLPSLHNSVWDISEEIKSVSLQEQMPIEKSQQLAIRRGRIGVEILKRPSDDQTKFDLFQRLNSGGTQANSQELRNCVMLMVNRSYFFEVKKAAELDIFGKLTGVNEDHKEKQRHMELAVRFLVHVLVAYDGKLDVEEFIDEGIVGLAIAGDGAGAYALIQNTFELLDQAAGADALRRYQGGNFVGKIGLVGLECIAVGVAKNLSAIRALGQVESVDFVRDRIHEFWASPDFTNFTSPGLRGTTRIQRTVPTGENWFRP